MHLLRLVTRCLQTLALLPLLATLPAAAFSFADVAELARRDAAAPYQKADPLAVPAVLRNLGYDAMRDIRFKPEHSVWRREGLPFELQLFHLGSGHLPVRIHEVAEGRVRELAYDPAAWDFGRQRLDRSGFGTLAHAGFRVHHALNSPAYKDELIVFLGASYFRALGRGQQYGLSARALAIDTVGAPAGQGEEFPRFKAFWIEKPAPGAQTLTIHALLDSPRATGAYRFTIKPGDSTTVDVQQRLFLRGPVARLGVAPLTSMFLHGENQRHPSDFRPEVHDSDGLQLAADGEWLWRPLFNPSQPLVSSLRATQLQGYGLMQRDRRFAAYEDDEARYDRRPSAWVEPLGTWGPGRVELLMLPTPDETHDNAVAYWVPDTPPAPGQPFDLAWRLHWQGQQPTLPPQAWATQARRGHGWGELRQGELQFVLDFDGPALRALPVGTTVTAMASAGRGATVKEARAWPHPQGGWRMQLRVQRDDPTTPLELRAWLRQGPHALTETWAALVPGESPAASRPVETQP
jgi:periplasmic glucans biosynthesis protein